MLARASILNRVAAVLVLGVCLVAVGCGKAAYEERMQNTIFQLTKQAMDAEQGGAAPAEGAPEGEAAEASADNPAPAN